MTNDLDEDIAELRGQRRRYAIARWLMIPVLVGAFWLAFAESPLWLLVGAVVLLIMQWFGVRVYLQYCPRCLSSLATGHWWARSLPPSCPMCDLPIEANVSGRTTR